MSLRIRLCGCMTWMSCIVLSSAALAGTASSAGTQSAASTQDVPLVWAMAGIVKHDASYMYNGMPCSQETGAWAVHPLESGKLGVFLAQSPVPDQDKQRLVFLDDKGVRHVADCGGWSHTDSVCMTFYRTPTSCPLKSVREIRLERQVPDTDPLVQRQKDYEQREARKPELAKQSPLPAFTAGKPYRFVLTDASGTRIDSKQLFGKVVILDFWATWCGPCVAELPRLKGLYERYHKQGLEIVSIDMGEVPRTVAAFVQAKQIPWLQAVLTATEDESVRAATGIDGIPHFLVLDRQGVLRDADARTHLEELLPDLLD